MVTGGSCVEVSADNVGEWAEITALASVTTRIKAVEPKQPFAARLRAMQLGACQLSEMSYGALLSQRTPRLIRQSDPELFQVAVISSGRQRIQQARNSALIRNGEMVLYDSSRPFDAYAENCPAGLGTRGVMFQFPKAMLPFPARRVDGLLAAPLSVRQGTGRLFAQFLTTAATEYSACTSRDADRLETTAVDLVTAVLAHHLDCEDDVPVDSRKQALYARITSFIESRLGDSDLTTGEIAAAHYISIRSLHRLFQQHGSSVHSWIRHKRLERCRRDLADPLQRHLSVRAIAARWGFPNPADFTRAFRALHGITPSTYRLQSHGRTTDVAEVPARRTM